METTVLTNVRLSYVHLLKAYANNPQQPAKYSTTIIIPKTDKKNMDIINAAINAAIEQGRNTKWNGVVPPTVPTPVHDGDGTKQDGTEYGPECKGCMVMNASNDAEHPVEVVDRRAQPIMDATQIYSGIIANVCVRFYPYSYQGKKGIGCGLGPVQKVADGEPLGSVAPKAKDVFSVLPGGAVNPVTGLPM
jgi:hypothetical protein